jgi:hypothetical protein
LRVPIKLGLKLPEEASGRRRPCLKPALQSQILHEATVGAVDIEQLEEITPQQWTELADGEREPWGPLAEPLTWRAKDHRIGVRSPDGRLIAVAAGVNVDIDVEGAGSFPVFGVGSVFVTPTERGRGLVTVLLEALLSGPLERPLERAMLFCRPELIAMYRKLAFAEVQAPVWVEQPAGRTEIAMRAMWRPLREGAGWPAGRVDVRGLPF